METGVFSDKNVDFNKFLTDDYVVILDTNVFLGLYRLSPDYVEFALACLTAIKDRIVIPYTVKIEFLKHCVPLYKTRQDRMENVAADIEKMVSEQKDSVMNGIGTLARRQFPDIDEFRDGIGDLYDEIASRISDYFTDRSVLDLLKDSWDVDKVKEFFDELCATGAVMGDLSRDVIYQICEEGEKRYKDQIPPGFRDAKKKDGIRKYSDLILWKETINFAHASQKNVVFVTDDVKPDWWNVQNNMYEFLPKLVSEFRKNSRLRESENGGVKGPELTIVPFVSLDFYESVARTFDIERTDAIEQALNLTSEEYIKCISSRVFDSVFSDLQYSGTNYVDESILSDVGSEGIEEWEIDEYEYESFEMYEREGNKIYYDITYRVVMTGYSFDYWGRDDDTKEVITSPAFEHEVTGNVVVRVEREVDMFIDFEDTNYESAEIVDTAFEETHFKSAYSDYDDEPDPDAEYCPDCGVKMTYENSAGAFCVDCMDRH